VPNQPGKPVIEVNDVPLPWLAESIAPRRQADVGHPALTYVTILSAVEARRMNEVFKKRAAEELRANLAAEGEDSIGQNIDENAAQAGERIDALLEAITQEGYFSSWVIVEECTID
jgi:hypothetical protein